MRRACMNLYCQIAVAKGPILVEGQVQGSEIN